MDSTTIDAIRAHANAEYPRESCGVVVDGVYRPCRNIAATAAEHFIIDPEDYMAAEDAGTVEFIVHSHPNAGCKPSQADRVSCEASGVPWLIVGVPDGVAGDVEALAPAGYVAPLLGRSYAHGILDCYSLIRDWYAQELGIELPMFEDRRDDWWKNGGNLYVENLERCGFRRVSLKEIRRGDMVLMQIRSNVPNHGGVYLGDGTILHHLENRLSSRDLYDGYFQQVTVLIARHKDAP